MTLNNEQHGNHEPSLTVESLQKELEQKAVEKNADFIKLLKSRNHELISGVYQNIDSRIVVICRIHGATHETTVRNYKKARTGMPCCGKARQSAATTYHNTLR
jgi:tRNA 2-selenouridine synthase SelU